MPISAKLRMACMPLKSAKILLLDKSDRFRYAEKKSFLMFK